MPPCLGSLTLGAVPRIAVPVSDADLRAHAQRLRRAADVVELRIDQFAAHSPEAVAAAAGAARAIGLPLLATVRASSEGGAVALDDAQRWALYEAAAPLVDGLDVELRAALCDRVVALAKRHGKLAVVSHHDFAATPTAPDLDGLAEAAARHGADVVKIAAYTAAAADLERLLHLLLARRAGGAIVIGMGPRGAASRVLFPLLGSLITYGFLETANAPGQLALEDLYDELRRYSPEFAATHPAR
jgi:3-dehydroquinate dehydratase-1